MKKLILLAVVVFGFTAMSFAQHVSPPANIVIPAIQPPAAISPALALTADAPMGFGQISNVKNGGIIHLTPGGVVSTTNGITLLGASTPAQFSIWAANILPVISLPIYYFPFTGGKLDINQATDCTIALKAGSAVDYTVKIGGTITLYDGATGAFTIGGLTISVNNQ